jgi:hypothetical protein
MCGWFNNSPYINKCRNQHSMAHGTRHTARCLPRELTFHFLCTKVFLGETCKMVSLNLRPSFLGTKTLTVLSLTLTHSLSVSTILRPLLSLLLERHRWQSLELTSDESGNLRIKYICSSYASCVGQT